MVVPLHLEELNGLAPSGIILLIEYHDRVLGISQIFFEWCNCCDERPRAVIPTTNVGSDKQRRKGE
jgi:hypothetical protein